MQRRSFLRDGAAISTATVASGNAGNININAEAIEITGIDDNTQLPSAITSAGGSLPNELSEAFFLPPSATGDARKSKCICLKHQNRCCRSNQCIKFLEQEMVEN